MLGLAALARPARTFLRPRLVGGGLLVAELLAVGRPQTALACFCGPGTLADEVARSALVISGRVVAERVVSVPVADAPGGQLEMTEYDIQVYRAWKGRPSSIVRVRNMGEDASCGYPLAVGQDYLLFPGTLRSEYRHDNAQGPPLPIALIGAFVTDPILTVQAIAYDQPRITSCSLNTRLGGAGPLLAQLGPGYLVGAGRQDLVLVIGAVLIMVLLIRRGRRRGAGAADGAG
jgi:hypothetical protein